MSTLVYLFLLLFRLSIATRVGLKVMATVDISNLALFAGVQHLYTFNVVPLFITSCQMFRMRRTPSARPHFLMFRNDRPIAQISSCLVLYQVPRSSSFILAKSS